MKILSHVCSRLLLLALLISLATACTTTKPAEQNNQSLITDKDPNAAPLPPEVQALIDQGDKAMANRQWKVAASNYEKALKQAPSWELAMNTAISQSKCQKFELAIVTMQQSLELGGSKQYIVWFNLGNLFQNRGMYEESIKAYRMGLSLRTQPDPEALLNITSAYLFLQRYAEAQATAERMIELNPKDPRPYHNLALIPQMQKKYKECVLAYERVHQIDPNFAQAYYNKADALAGGLDRYSEGIAAFRKYIQLAPNGPYVKRANEKIKLFQSKIPSS